MSEAKSKRDLIWEQKKKAREQKQLQSIDQQQSNDDYQPYPQSKQYPDERKAKLFEPALDNNDNTSFPISFPSGNQNQKTYPNINPTFNEPIEQPPIQQQQKQYESPPQFQAENNFIKAQKISVDYDIPQIASNNVQQQQQLPLERENINQNKFIKAQYGEYLKDQMNQKEEQKQKERNQNQGGQIQQQQQQQPINTFLQDEKMQQKNQKAQYGEYLRNQMQEKELNKNQQMQLQQNSNNNVVQAQQYQETYLQQQQPQQSKFDPDEINKKNQKAQYGEYLRQQMQAKQQQQGNNQQSTVDKKLLLQQKMEQQFDNPFGKAGAGAPNRNQIGQPIVKRNVQQFQQDNAPPIQQQFNNPAQQQYFQQLQQQQQQYQPPPQQQPYYPPPSQEKPQFQQQPPPNNFYQQNDMYQQNALYNQPPPRSQQQYPPINQYQMQPQQQQQPYLPYQQEDQYYPQNQDFGGQRRPMETFPQGEQGPSQQPLTYQALMTKQQQQMTEKQRKILELQEKNENYQYDPQVENQQKFKEGQRNLLKNENVSNDEINRKKQQQQDYQKAILEQIEQKKMQKEIEDKKRKQEEQQEEERLKREQEELEQRKKDEEQGKKKSAATVEQVNEEQRNQRQKRRRGENDGDNNKNNDAGNKASVVNVPQQLRTDISKDFIKGEKQRDGVESSDSLADFYRKRSANRYDGNNNNNVTPDDQKIQFINVGGGGAALQQQQQVGQLPPTMIPQIEEIKKVIQDQQQQMQQNLQQMRNETQQAVQQRDKAEKELQDLKEQLKQKMIAEEMNQRKLRNALSKYNPEKHTTYLMQPPTQTPNPLYDIQNQIPSNPLPKAPIFQQKPPTINPIRQGDSKYYYGNNQQQEEQFKQNVGIQSLVSDNKFIPLDIIDSIQSGEKITMSKLMNFNGPQQQQQQPYQAYQRPNSSRVFSNQEKDYANQMYNQKQDNNNYKLKNDDVGTQDLYNKRPNSSQSENKWAMASINSDITKEIDMLLKNQISNQPKPVDKQFQQNDSIALDGIRNNNNQKQQNNNFRAMDIGDSPSTFNYAAKGILGQHNNNGTFTVNENNENAQAMSMYSEFPDLNALDINGKRNISQVSQNEFFHNNLSNLSRQTDKYMQFNSNKPTNTPGLNQNASMASVTSDKDIFKQQAINTLGMKGSGVAFNTMNTMGNNTQGTFDVEQINKKNEDRLKQLMALGLNTVNEEDEPLKKTHGRKQEEGQDELDRLDKLLDKYND